MRKLLFTKGLKKRLNKFKEQYELSPNIILMGIVDKVPYSKHQCYISSSYSELFANAFVEVASNGLLALLSDVDIAHRYYAGQSDSITLFRNKIELIEKYYKWTREFPEI